MRLKSILLLAILCTGISRQTYAQDSLVNIENVSPDTVPGMNALQRVAITPQKYKAKPLRNLVKINLTSLALKTYSVQYERVLNKTISISGSFRTMPSSGIPFKGSILKAIGDDDEAKNILETLKLANFAFTPEVRFYVGRNGYGRGFYLALFYRYAKFTANDLLLTYDGSSGTEQHLNMSGELTTNTGGFMLGSQWLIGKRMCLDWWILGPHYGSGKGIFSGASVQPLTQDDQDDLRGDLEGLDIPLIEKTVSVNAQEASLKLQGPWAGVRAGISLGFRF